MVAYFRGLVRRIRRKPLALSVRVSDDGLMLFDGNHLRRCVAWGEVLEVITFKRDLITYDDICLAFRIEGGWVELSEDIEGWSELLGALERHFPTTPPDWYRSVMLPPFETCYRVLYERA